MSLYNAPILCPHLIPPSNAHIYVPILCPASTAAILPLLDVEMTYEVRKRKMTAAGGGTPPI